MKVKFCGMTNVEDVMYAVELGVDFVGFVFYPRSPRFVEYKTVRDILKQTGGAVKSVGVFVNNPESEIRWAMEYCGLDYAQVYSDIPIERTIRVYRIKDKLPDKVKEDGLILFDSYSNSIGGSGKQFNLALLKNFNQKDRLFVAGGVSLKNIERIAKLGVFGVDLVSSVELFPGKKDPVKMREFILAVRRLA